MMAFGFLLLAFGYARKIHHRDTEVTEKSEFCHSHVRTTAGAEGRISQYGTRLSVSKPSADFCVDPPLARN